MNLQQQYKWLTHCCCKPFNCNNVLHKCLLKYHLCGTVVNFLPLKHLSIHLGACLYKNCINNFTIFQSKVFVQGLISSDAHFSRKIVSRTFKVFLTQLSEKNCEIY